MRRFFYFAVLALVACTKAAPAAPLKASVVQAKAQECGIKSDQLKFIVDASSVIDVHVGPNSAGQVPDFKALKCFITWAETQRGIRVGFISEPPPTGAER